MDQHEHVGGAGIFRRHTLDFDGLLLPERRNDFRTDARGLKRELDFVIEVAMPPYDQFFRSISVRHAVVVASSFPDWVFLWCPHDLVSRMRRTDVLPISNRHADSTF